MGLREAADLCKVSVSTLRRRREQLKEHGATVTDEGWAIPIPALITLGLLDRTTPPDVAPPDAPSSPGVKPTTTPPTETPLTAPVTTPLAGEVERLREQLAAAERRAAVAEAVAAERDRIIQAQAYTLRMLEAPPTSPQPAPPPPAAEPVDAPVSRLSEPAPSPAAHDEANKDVSPAPSAQPTRWARFKRWWAG